MEIDWFTFGAQVINFLILIWLLRKFLYGPIVSAMERREETIRERLSRAEEKEQEARREAEAAADERKDLENRREELIAHAREQAEERKKAWMADARAEVDQQEGRWREAVRQQQAAFMRELRDRSAEQLLAAGKRMLDDLADASLEARLLETFLTRLAELDDSGRRALQDALQAADGAPVVSSSFELTDEARHRIEDTLAECVSENPDVRFTVKASMPLGIELKLGGWKLAWGVESYVSAVEQEVQKVFANESRRPTDGDGQRRGGAGTGDHTLNNRV